MKINFILLAFVLLISCNEDDKFDDPFYTNFNDTVLETQDINFLTTFDFDIDKNNVIDISIGMKEGYLASSSYDSYIQIDTKNNWEILFSTIIDTSYEWSPNAPDTSFHYHTVLMPKINSIKDTINIMDNYTNESVMLVYNEVLHPMIRPYSKGISRDQWIGQGYKYMVLRDENENKLVWLKINVISHHEMIVSSSKYVIGNEIIIND